MRVRQSGRGCGRVARVRRLIAAGVLLAAAGIVACHEPRAVPPPLEQATADCVSPSYATDVLVCGDPDLRALDGELARIWRIVTADRDTGQRERDAQVAWFRRRSLCAFQTDHAACVEAAYRARIAELQDRRR